MKHLPPTLRENQRYLKLEIGVENQKSFSELVDIINSAVKEFTGDKGLAESNPWLIKKKFDFEKQQVVVRINRDFEEMFRAAIIFSDYRIITLNSSGTLDSL